MHATVRKRLGIRFILALTAALAGPARGGLAESIQGFDGGGDSPLPAELSATGLYKDIASPRRAVSEGIEPFEINSPLWSDGARKERYLALPAGTAIVPTDTEGYRFPDRTVFIKSFRIDTVYGDTTTAILIETRFLVYHQATDGDESPWHGISYHWRRDQSDADLVSQERGENFVQEISMNGIPRGKRWTYPSKDQCVICHFNRGVLGFITPQLNRPSRADASVNQLQDLATRGILTFNPVAGKPQAMRWAGLRDTAASLEMRARSYFAGNCSHCHGTKAHPGNHNFDFYHADLSIDQGPDGPNGAYVGKLTHQGGPAFPQFVYKGYPESSYVLKRMSVRQDFGFTPTEQMPTLATFQPDSTALNLLRDWICSLGNRGAGVCRLPQVQADSTFWEKEALAGLRSPASHPVPDAPGFNGPTLRGGILRVTPGLLASGSHPRLSDWLFDYKGRPLALMETGNGEFRILGPISPGIYFLKTAAGTAMVLMKE